MDRLCTAIEGRYKDRGVQHKVYTPGNLETLELSIRQERIAKVSSLRPCVLQDYIRARLSEGLVPRYRGKVTSCLACVLPRIVPIRSWMRRT